MLEWVMLLCPYCGETFETAVDGSAGSRQYVEDCQICCNPILFDITVDGNGQRLTVDARQENE